MGTHTAATLGSIPDLVRYDTQGIVTIGRSTKTEPLLPSATLGLVRETPSGEWWSKLGSSPVVSDRLLAFASHCESQLPRLLKTIKLDIPKIPTSPPLSNAANPGSMPVKAKSQPASGHHPYIKEEFNPHVTTHGTPQGGPHGYGAPGAAVGEVSGGVNGFATGNESTSPVKDPHAISVKDETSNNTGKFCGTILFYTCRQFVLLFCV